MNIPFPCHTQNGDYVQQDGCYYTPMPKPWPSFGPWNTNPDWAKIHPTGGVYSGWCYGYIIGGVPANDGVQHWKWFDNPPGQNVPTITPAQAAADFIATLTFYGPSISVAPPSGSTVLVGMPMYLWSPDNADYWGPKAIGPVAFEGYAISLTVKATSITWYPGDGSSFDCDHGSEPGSGGPTCSHTYLKSSAAEPGQTYEAYGVTHWELTWSAGGQNNFNDPIHKDVRSGQNIAIKVGEAQAVVQH